MPVEASPNGFIVDTLFFGVFQSAYVIEVKPR